MVEDWSSTAMFATSGGVLVLAAVTSLVASVRRGRARCPFTALTVSDAAFSATAGGSLLAMSTELVPRPLRDVFGAAVFSSSLCNALHSCVPIALHTRRTCTGRRHSRALSLGLGALSWVLPALWACFLVLPNIQPHNGPLARGLVNLCEKENKSDVTSITSLLVQRIYGLVRQDLHRNRSERNFEEMKPEWFEEKYDDYYEDDVRTDGLPTATIILNETDDVSDQLFVKPNVSSTIEDCTPLDCSSDDFLRIYLVAVVFASYLVPLVLAAVLNTAACVEMKTRAEERVTAALAASAPPPDESEFKPRPLPRHRSSPSISQVFQETAVAWQSSPGLGSSEPVPAPRTRVGEQQDATKCVTRGRAARVWRLSRVLTAASAAVWAPALACALLRASRPCGVAGTAGGTPWWVLAIELAAPTLQGAIRSTVQARLLGTMAASSTAVHPQ